MKSTGLVVLLTRIFVRLALQDSEQNRMRGADVGDGKEAASEGTADTNGVVQLHTDDALSGDVTAAASANDKLEQVRSPDRNKRLPCLALLRGRVFKN